MHGKAILLLAGILCLSSCAGLGPATVSRDRFDYTAAISDSWKRQMLYNLVKIRYGDAPVFLDVSSVISQYQIGGQISLGATLNNNPWSTSETLGATGNYVERPTITFTPVIGDKFARSLMSPIPPSAVLSLVQGGYPVDLVFRLLVHEINGRRNRFGGDMRAYATDPEFHALVQKMRKIQLAGAIGMRHTKADKQETALLVIRRRADPAIDVLSREVRGILGLDPQADEFRVSYGAIPRDNQEIAILTRSILEVLVDISTDIEVPASDVEEKRVSPTFAETVAGEKIAPMIRIRSSPEKQADAFVSVAYRGAHFWIDDRDLASKKIFTFLMFVFTLVETGDKGGAPIVTIPTG
jgi:hypothetical protein